MNSDAGNVHLNENEVAAAFTAAGSPGVTSLRCTAVTSLAGKLKGDDVSELSPWEGMCAIAIGDLSRVFASVGVEQLRDAGQSVLLNVDSADKAALPG